MYFLNHSWAWNVLVRFPNLKANIKIRLRFVRYKNKGYVFWPLDINSLKQVNRGWIFFEVKSLEINVRAVANLKQCELIACFENSFFVRATT